MDLTLEVHYPFQSFDSSTLFVVFFFFFFKSQVMAKNVNKNFFTALV